MEIPEEDRVRYYAKLGRFTMMQGISDDDVKFTHCVEPSFAEDREMWIANFWNKKVPESARAPELDAYQVGKPLPTIKS